MNLTPPRAAVSTPQVTSAGEPRGPDRPSSDVVDLSSAGPVPGAAKKKDGPSFAEELQSILVTPVQPQLPPVSPAPTVNHPNLTAERSAEVTALLDGMASALKPLSTDAVLGFPAVNLGPVPEVVSMPGTSGDAALQASATAALGKVHQALVPEVSGDPPAPVLIAGITRPDSLLAGQPLPTGLPPKSATRSAVFTAVQLTLAEAGDALQKPEITTSGSSGALPSAPAESMILMLPGSAEGNKGTESASLQNQVSPTSPQEKTASLSAGNLAATLELGTAVGKEAVPAGTPALATVAADKTRGERQLLFGKQVADASSALAHFESSTVRGAGPAPHFGPDASADRGSPVAAKEMIAPASQEAFPVGVPAPGPTAADAAHAPTRTLSVADQLSSAILGRAEVATRQGRMDFHIRLEPPELGSVRVHLIATDQGISARLMVHEESARQLIESQMQSLRQRLMDMGISLGRFDVARDGTGSQGQGQQRWAAPFSPQVSPEAPWLPQPPGVALISSRQVDVVA